MANQSIYKAFERMWMHIVSTFAKKTEVTEIIEDLGAVTIDIDDAAEGTATGINANQLGGYNVDQFLRKDEIINADQLDGYNANQFLKKDEEINANTFNNHTIDYFLTKSDAGEVLSNAMLKTGGEFVGNVTMAKNTNIRYQISDNVFVLVGYSNGEFVVSTNNNGTWNELVRLNTDGSVKSGLLMPKSGGTFTGNVRVDSGPSTNTRVRNIMVHNASGTNVSTDYIYMVRK